MFSSLSNKISQENIFSFFCFGVGKIYINLGIIIQLFEIYIFMHFYPVTSSNLPVNCICSCQLLEIYQNLS